jgi:hypothetical protein
MSRNRHYRIPAFALALFVATAAPAQSVPARLADSTFWRLMTTFSEPGGFFRSDNFVSNESSFQYVIPELQRTIAPGGVYLGVAPDQNFTYIVALKPGIAFIVDIRHQNAMQHLMYKALIELSSDRIDFVSRLFSKPRPAGLDTTATAQAIFQAIGPGFPDSASFRRTLTDIKHQLLSVHGFAMSVSELESLDYVFGAFYTSGPSLTYNFGGGGGGSFGRGMPSYDQLQVESDGTGINRAYMGSEANFRALKDMEQRNLIVPLTGNFAGDKALRAVGNWAREHGAVVTTFYTSNVEQYLWGQGDEAPRFYRNVATLPLDSTSTFIRSYSQGNGISGFRQQSPTSRSLQLLSSIQATLKAFTDGALAGYWDIIRLSHQ